MLLNYENVSFERVSFPQFNGYWAKFYTTPEKLVSDAFTLFEYKEPMEDEACKILGLPAGSTYEDAGSELLIWGVEHFGFGAVALAVEDRAFAAMPVSSEVIN